MIIVCAIVLVGGFWASKSLEETLLASVGDRLELAARLVAGHGGKPLSSEMTELNQPAAQAAHALAGQLTIVRADGSVVFETQADAAATDNHRERPEIVEALAGKTGQLHSL